MTVRNYHKTCFHCGLSLKDWVVSDSVWQEHSKWSPKWILVAYNKGIVFVLTNAQILETVQLLNFPVCNAIVVCVFTTI